MEQREAQEGAEKEEEWNQKGKKTFNGDVPSRMTVCIYWNDCAVVLPFIFLNCARVHVSVSELSKNRKKRTENLFFFWPLKN